MPWTSIFTTSASQAGSTQKAKVTPQKEKEMVVLTVEKPLPAGTAKVHITYTGILNRRDARALSRQRRSRPQVRRQPVRSHRRAPRVSFV